MFFIDINLILKETAAINFLKENRSKFDGYFAHYRDEFKNIDKALKPFENVKLYRDLQEYIEYMKDDRIAYLKRKICWDICKFMMRSSILKF